MAETPMDDEGSSDLQLANSELKTPKSAEADVTIARLLTSKTSPPPAPFTPSKLLSDKQKRLKPARHESSSTNAKKKHSPSKHKGVRDTSRTCSSLGKEKVASKGSDTPVEISPTMVRAGEIQSSLGTKHPSFIKTMLKSHVATCFWMGLPVPFCKSFLPKNDTLMVVEDENGQKYNLKYIANKTGLSAGWRKFAIVHNLLEGDVLIFHLVESCKFKIYIVRANDSKEGDADLNPLNWDAHTEHNIPETMMTYSKSKTKKRSSSSSLPSTKDPKNHKRSEPPTELSNHTTEHSGVESEIQGDSPETNLSLEEVKTFKDFRIMVNNQCIDSDLPEEIRKSYYNLCIAKKECLHDGILKGMYYKLVAGMIGETVRITNAIKACMITTSKEEFEAWDSSLKSFELIGMKVGFLRDKIRLLEKFAIESEDTKRYVEAKEKRSGNEYKMKILEAEVVELKESNRKIDAIMSSLKEKAEKDEVEFQENVSAPW